jgi:hypothetical protein
MARPFPGLYAGMLILTLALFPCCPTPTIARTLLDQPLEQERGSNVLSLSAHGFQGSDSDPPSSSAAPGETLRLDSFDPMHPHPQPPDFPTFSIWPQTVDPSFSATAPSALPSIVEGSEPSWSAIPPPDIGETGKLSTTVEHGRLKLSLDTGVARDPSMPENIALESYLVRLSLGQQAIAFGDVTVRETGLWRPLASRGALGSLDLLGMTGGLFLVKDPAAADEDSMLTGGMIERRLFDSGVRIRAMAAHKEDEGVTSVGLSTPLLGETLGLSGDLFRSSRMDDDGDALRVRASGKHAQLSYGLGFSRFGSSYSNPFRPEQTGGYDETTLDLSTLLPFPGDRKLSTTYGLRLREGSQTTVLLHNGRVGMTLGEGKWLVTPVYTLILVEPLYGDTNSMEQHGASISAKISPWPDMTLTPSLSYEHRTASNTPSLIQTWRAGLKTSMAIHPGSDLQFSIERMECNADGSFQRNQWSLWSRFAWSPAFLEEDQREWSFALENRFSRRTSFTESVDEMAFSIRLDIPTP